MGEESDGLEPVGRGEQEGGCMQVMAVGLLALVLSGPAAALGRASAGHPFPASTRAQNSTLTCASHFGLACVVGRRLTPRLPREQAKVDLRKTGGGVIFRIGAKPIRP